MVFLILIGIILLFVKRVRITDSLVLSGNRAHGYGLALAVTAFPFSMLLDRLTPEALLAHPIGSYAITACLYIAYVIVLALPFRDRKKTEEPAPVEPAA